MLKREFNFVSEEIFEELSQANMKHPPMADPVEGFYTLLCEVTELQREIMKKEKDWFALRAEAVQCGAMVAKLIGCIDNASED